MSYPFRREDNGQIVEVDFETAMGMDALGYITLPCGTQARRVREASYKSESGTVGAEKPVVSDALGFCEYQLNDFETDRKMNGIKGIEFVRDPSFPQYIQVKGSQKAIEEYSRHRGFEDKNPHGGAAMTPAMLARARERVAEEYGCST